MVFARKNRTNSLKVKLNREEMEEAERYKHLGEGYAQYIIVLDGSVGEVKHRLHKVSKISWWESFGETMKEKSNGSKI